MTATVRRSGLFAPLAPSLGAPSGSGRNRRRLMLLGSSALVGSVLLAGQASAQNVPDLANAGGATVTVVGPPGNPNALNINLNDASRILDFNSYNIAAGKTVNYTTTTAGTTDLVAVNRVLTGGGTSIIDGDINAASGISVWLINQDGITFNGNATLGGGSLMLSTLDFSATVDNAFRTAFAVAGAANSTAFQFSGTSTSPIIFNAGSLNVAGSIVAVGQSITTDTAMTAGNGSVVLVAGSDVTFTNGLGNPLSFTVNAGTALGGGVTVNDDLTGQSVVVAGGMQNNLTAALLNIDANATLTATDANGAVVLATSTTAFGTETVGITNGLTTQASITLDGDLVASGANGDVSVNSDADLTGAGSITANRNLSLATGGDAGVAGSDYTATNGFITASVGGDATFGTLTSGGDITVTTGGNAIYGDDVDAGARFLSTSGLDTTITGNVTAGTDVGLTVLQDTFITGDIAAGNDYTLSGTRDLTQSGDAVAGNNAVISIGDNASVTGANRATAGALSISTGLDAALGALSAGTDITVTSTAGSTTLNGIVGAGGGLAVTSDTDITINAAVTSGADVALTAGNDALIAGPITAGQDYIVDTTRDYTQTSNVTATRNVDLTVGRNASVTGALRATNGFNTALVTNDASFAALSAGTDISVNAGDNAALTGTTGAGGQLTVVSGLDTTISGNVTTVSDISLTAGRDTLISGTISGGGTFTDITTNDYTQSGPVTAAGNVDLTIGNDALVTGATQSSSGFVSATIGNDGTFGPITAGTDIQVTATGNLALNGTLTAGRDIDVGAGLDLTVPANASAGRDYLLIGNRVTLGTAGQVRNQIAGGLVSVRAQTFDITGLGTLTLQSGGGFDIELRADLAEVNFDQFNSSLDAGAGNVVVTSAPNITLGNVTAARLFTASDTALSATGTIRTGDLTIANPLTILSTTGSVQTGNVTIQNAGAALEIHAGGAPGDVTTGALSTNRGDILISAARDILLGGASTALLDPATAPVAGSVGLFSGGSTTTGALIAGEDIAVHAGTTITATAATAGDDIDFLATGDISLDDGTTLGTGTGASAIAFGATPGIAGSVSVAGAEDPGLADSMLRLNSTAGSVTSTGTLTNQGGGDVSIFAQNDITLGAAVSTLRTINLLAGGSIDATSLTAADIIANAGVDVDITSANAVTGILDVDAGRDATVDTGTAGGLIDIDAGRSIFSGNALTANGGDVTLNAFQDITVDTIDANGGSALLTAITGSISGIDVGAILDVNALGTVDVTLGSASAGGSVIANAGNDASIGTASAGSGLFVTAGNNASVGAGSASVIIDIDAGNSITSATSLTTSAGDVLLGAGQQINVNAVTATGGAANLTAGTFITGTTIQADTGINVQAGQDAMLGTANSGAALIVNAGGNVLVGTGQAVSLIDIDAGGSMISTALVATTAGDILIDAATAITVDTVNAGGGNANLTAALSIAGNSVNADASVNVLAGTDANLGAASAGGALIVNAGGNASVGTGSASSLIDIDAVGSITSGTSLTTSAGSIQLDAGQAITVAALTATGGSASLTAGTSITGTTVNATGDVDATAGTSVNLGSATAGGNINVLAATDAILGSAAAGGVLNVDAGGDASVGVGSASSLIDIDAGGSLTTNASLTTSAGDILLNAGQTMSSATIAATGGSVSMTAGTTINGTTTSATGDVNATAGTSSIFGTINAGGSINLAAAGDVFVVGSATAGGVLNIDAGNNVSIVTGTAGLLIDIDAGGSITSATSLTTTTGSIHLDAGQAITVASASATDDVNATAGTDANLVTTVAVGSINVSAVNDVTLGSAIAGGWLNVDAGGNASVGSGTTGSLIDIDAGGDVSIGTGNAGSLIDIDAGGSVTSATSLTSSAGNIDIDAGQAITVATVAANLGSANLTAATSVTGTTVSATDDVNATAGTSVNLGAATAGGSINVLAANDVGLGSAAAGGALNVDAGGNASIGTGSAGSLIDVVAGGSITSATSLTTTSGDILLNAGSNIDVAGVSATGGTVALLAGGTIEADNLSATEDIAARAGGTATFGTLAAGDDIEITAAGLVSITGTTDITATGTGRDTRHAVFDPALAGQGGGITLAAGDAATDLRDGRNIIVAAPDVSLAAALTIPADGNTAGRIVLRNTGTGSTTVGDDTTSTATFAVSDAEFDLLNAKTVVVDSGARNLEIGTLTIREQTGTSDVRFLSTGAVELTGPLTVSSTAGKTVQIGGVLGALGDDAGAVPLATTIVMKIDGPKKPRIDAGSSEIELRGEKVLFGTTLMVNDYLTRTDAEIAGFVSNPTSLLYSDLTAQNQGVFLTANSVTVGYRNFALFQNTRVSSNEGVLINSTLGGVPTQTETALRLVSTGDDGANAFAMFGIVNNFQGTTAALLTNEAIQIVNPSGNANDFRITRATSRLNGCVIGAPDKGCLSTDVPQPNFDLYDERGVAVFDAGDDGSLSVSPLIGRGNDGLIVNIADAPVGIDTLECRPEDVRCPAKEGQ